MAKALLEWETLDADQINDIMEGKAAASAQAEPEHSRIRRRTVHRRHRQRLPPIRRRKPESGQWVMSDEC